MREDIPKPPVLSPARWVVPPPAAGQQTTGSAEWSSHEDMATAHRPQQGSRALNRGDPWLGRLRRFRENSGRRDLYTLHPGPSSKLSAPPSCPHRLRYMNLRWAHRDPWVSLSAPRPGTWPHSACSETKPNAKVNYIWDSNFIPRREKLNDDLRIGLQWDSVALRTLDLI